MVCVERDSSVEGLKLTLFTMKSIDAQEMNKRAIQRMTEIDEESQRFRRKLHSSWEAGRLYCHNFLCHWKWSWKKGMEKHWWRDCLSSRFVFLILMMFLFPFTLYHFRPFILFGNFDTCLQLLLLYHEILLWRKDLRNVSDTKEHKSTIDSIIIVTNSDKWFWWDWSEWQKRRRSLW